jgi:hypothetical protein
LQPVAVAVYVTGAVLEIVDGPLAVATAPTVAVNVTVSVVPVPRTVTDRSV